MRPFVLQGIPQEATRGDEAPLDYLTSHAEQGLVGVDPADGTIYGADSRGYTTDGRVLRYGANGTALGEFGTAVGPTHFVF